MSQSILTVIYAGKKFSVPVAEVKCGVQHELCIWQSTKLISNRWPEAEQHARISYTAKWIRVQPIGKMAAPIGKSPPLASSISLAAQQLDNKTKQKQKQKQKMKNKQTKMQQAK